jgi:predicted DNA-binding transcriptional regulator AlpA
MRQFLSVRQVMEATTLSRTSLWRAVQRGELRPIQLSPGRVGFDRTAVEGWLESKVTASTAGPEAR